LRPGYARPEQMAWFPGRTLTDKLLLRVRRCTVIRLGYPNRVRIGQVSTGQIGRAVSVKPDFIIAA
jgi:hypothetical protein